VPERRTHPRAATLRDLDEGQICKPADLERATIGQPDAVGGVEGHELDRFGQREQALIGDAQHGVQHGSREVIAGERVDHARGDAFERAEVARMRCAAQGVRRAHHHMKPARARGLGRLE